MQAQNALDIPLGKASTFLRCFLRKKMLSAQSSERITQPKKFDIGPVCKGFICTENSFLRKSDISCYTELHYGSVGRTAGSGEERMVAYLASHIRFWFLPL
jgi:hypothetical protein